MGNPDEKDPMQSNGVGIGADAPLVPSLELVTQARDFVFEGAKLWEEKLKLVVAPRPLWCPRFVYGWAVRLVVKQERDRNIYHEQFTRRRRWQLFRPKA